MLRPRLRLRRGWAYMFLFAPMSSTRYFEFDFAWRALSDFLRGRYLDVSSPRLFPILFARAHPEVSAELINPDANDLSITTDLASACGIEQRVHTDAQLIQEAHLEPGTFDAISSLSVVEHIPHAGEAISRMWDWLKPGGKLILSLPCAAQAYEEWINAPVYGLLEPDAQGYNFLQYVYDQALLEENIFRITGTPRRMAIYGEKHPGFMREYVETRQFSMGPFWREPYMMGREFRRAERLSDLPGEGVIAMEFIKP
ncbi:MAG TPA: methyltransferase domain-containing protein [Anaerolineae bacterium]